MQTPWAKCRTPCSLSFLPRISSLAYKRLLGTCWRYLTYIHPVPDHHNSISNSGNNTDVCQGCASLQLSCLDYSTVDVTHGAARLRSSVPVTGNKWTRYVTPGRKNSLSHNGVIFASTVLYLWHHYTEHASVQTPPKVTSSFHNAGTDR